MSTQTNQYLMWGVSLPYEWHEEWEKQHGKPGGFYDQFEDFMDDSAFESTVKHKDGIFCAFDGRDGRFILIGRVIAKAKDGDLLGEGAPLSVPPLTPLEQELIKNSVERHFGIPATADYRHWLFTQFR
jgi:hypothetical protein